MSVSSITSAGQPRGRRVGSARRFLLTAAVAAIAAMFPAAAAEAAAPSCKRGQTWLATGNARLFSITLDRFKWTYYACYGKGRARKLGIEEPESGIVVGPVALAGRFAAFDQMSCPRDGGCTAAVGVLDLKTGKRTVTPARTYPLGPGGYWTADVAAALVLSARGSAAWSRNAGGGTAEIVARPAGQPEQVLDTVATADARSLAIADGVIYWTNAGQPRSAPLP